jgi:excisionase family DNA binding protein
VWLAKYKPEIQRRKPMEKILLPIWPDTGAALGGLGRTKIYELIASGELRTVKIGRRRFIPADAIREYVARLERAASPAA